jgi:Flp pilus assembly pilin Flp
MDPPLAAPPRTRTLLLRLMRDEHGVWHTAVSEPGSADNWRTVCDGLDEVWSAITQRLATSPDHHAGVVIG